jgi:hypothetical protein
MTQHTALFAVIYVFVVMELNTRRIVNINVTTQPSLPWVKRQIIHLSAFDRSPRFLLHDNDGIFGQFGHPNKGAEGKRDRCHLDVWLDEVLEIKGLIAVGTALTGRPARRSQRALLAHWAPASGSDVKAPVRPGMANTYRRDPAVDKSPHALPIGPIALVPASQSPVLLACHLVAKPCERLTVVRHCVVGKVPVDNTA